MVLEDVSLPKKSVKSSLPSGESTPEVKRYMAAPVDRLAAVMADLVIIIPIASLFSAPFRRKLQLAELLQDTTGVIEAFGFLLGALILTYVAYQTIFLSRWGTTPGKRILGLYVGSIGSGDAPTPKQAALRAWFWCVGVMLACLPWLGVLSNFKRRPWHDRIADTEVFVIDSKIGVPTPDLREQSIAGGLQSMVLCLVFAMFVAVFGQMGRQTDKDILRFGAAPSAHPFLCEEVSESYEGWLTRDGKKPSRLEVALTLYAAESVSGDCLQTEADYSLWNQGDKAKAYLAKAIVTDDEEAAEAYAAKVCESKGGEALCQLSKLALSPEEHEPIVDDLVKTAAASEPFYSVFFIRSLMNLGRYREALSFLDKGSPHKRMAHFFAEGRAQALWNLSLKDQARLALKSSLEGLEPSERISLARWSCDVESARACTAEAVSSCELLSGAVKSSPAELEDQKLALTWVRSEECLAGTKVDYKQMKSVAPGEDLQTLLTALELKQKGKGDESRSKLQALAGKLEPDSPLWFEINFRLADGADAATVASVLDTWSQSDIQGEPQWTRLGTALFARADHLGKNKEAISIGAQLSEFGQADEDIQKRVAAAGEMPGRMPASILQNPTGASYPFDRRMR